jgi:hypothetical protein
VENNERYGRFRNFPFNEDIKKKLHKLEQFNSLLYYLYVNYQVRRNKEPSTRNKKSASSISISGRISIYWGALNCIYSIGILRILFKRCIVLIIRTILKIDMVSMQAKSRILLYKYNFNSSYYFSLAITYKTSPKRQQYRNSSVLVILPSCRP